MKLIDRIRFARYKRKREQDDAFRYYRLTEKLKYQIFYALYGPFDGYHNSMFVWLDEWDCFEKLIKRYNLKYKREDLADKPLCRVVINW